MAGMMSPWMRKRAICPAMPAAMKSTIAATVTVKNQRTGMRSRPL